MSSVGQTTPTLTELQQWGPGEFEQHEPCLWQGDPVPKRVIKTIVRAAARELEWRGERNANSLRDFWYNPTKPILERAFPEKLEDPTFDFGRRMSQYLSETLSEMVQQGEYTYRELNILDDSREREIHLDSIEHDKILFVEKDAAYRKLRPLEEVYELSLVSGSGWQATALIEDLAYELDASTSYTLFVLTDYDPTGWKIADDFERRSSTLGVDIEAVERVGILPEQLDAGTIQQQRFSPPTNSDNDEEWLATYGIEGRYGLEIEAIGDLNRKGEALRRMVVDELQTHIDERARRQRDTNVAMANGAAGALHDVVDRITSDLEDALRDAVIEELADREGVNRLYYEDGMFFANVDFDAAEDGREHLPEPFDEGELHEGAVDGIVPVTDQSPPREWAEEQVWQQIQAGEIDPAEHLDYGSGQA